MIALVRQASVIIAALFATTAVNGVQGPASADPKTLVYAARRHRSSARFVFALADNSVPHGQSVLLYEALKAAGNEATLRLVDGLPHTFFNRSDLDEVAGPFRMDVRETSGGGAEVQRVERAGAFAVTREFFRRHLK